MPRTSVRLVAILLTAGTTLLVGTPAAIADPPQQPSRELPTAASSASMNSPQFTVPHGRKLS